MRYRQFNLLALLWIAIVSFAAAGGEITSLDQARLASRYARFTGNFTMHSPDRSSLAIVITEHGQLRMWYLCGNITSSSFGISLKRVGQTSAGEEQTSRGRTWVERTQTIEGDVATSLVEETARTWRMVERASLTHDRGQLTFRLARTYFKRRFIWFGAWTEDLTSFDGQKNTVHVEWRLSRQTKEPMTWDAFRAYARTIPESYLVLKTSVNADELAGVISRGECEIKTDAQIDRSAAERLGEVVDLARVRRERCATTLDGND